MEQPNANIVTTLIEIPTTNIGVKEFSLGPLPDVREAKRIMQIEAFSVTQITNAPSGKPVINVPVFNNAFLRLVSPSNKEYRAIPLLSLQKTNGTPLPLLNTPNIDTDKSKIVLGVAANLNAGEVFLLAITYEK